jgi:hypothetical protein
VKLYFEKFPATDHGCMQNTCVIFVVY